MDWLDPLCFIYVFSALLSNCLSENSLMTFVSLLLSIDVVKWFIVSKRAECLVLVCLCKSHVLNLLDFTFSLLLELVGQGNHEVFLPKQKLRSDGRSFFERNKVFVTVSGEFAVFFKLLLHSKHNLVFFFAVH